MLLLSKDSSVCDMFYWFVKTFWDNLKKIAYGNSDRDSVGFALHVEKRWFSNIWI